MRVCCKAQYSQQHLTKLLLQPTTVRALRERHRFQRRDSSFVNVSSDPMWVGLGCKMTAISLACLVTHSLPGVSVEGEANSGLPSVGLASPGSLHAGITYLFTVNGTDLKPSRLTTTTLMFWPGSKSLFPTLTVISRPGSAGFRLTSLTSTPLI